MFSRTVVKSSAVVKFLTTRLITHWESLSIPSATLVLLLFCCTASAPPRANSQAAPVSADLPSFDAATIKLPDPKTGGRRMAGFYGDPGGRVFFGGDVNMLVEIAFNLEDYQVAGGPSWAASQWFEINAVPPETSSSRSIKIHNGNPTPEQRLMLQSLLRDRFGLKFHLETKEGEVFTLTRGSKPLQLKPPKDPAADPRAIIVIRPSGVDGEALGINTTTDYLAQRLGGYLRLPVLNQTGIAGSYDFDLPPDDPENQDLVTAVLSVVDRLGLKLKRGHGPVRTLVIDRIEQPSEN
jgi:uncharacterized protein (TIGR03435 family)